MVTSRETGFHIAFPTVTSLPSGLIFFRKRGAKSWNLIKLEPAPVKKDCCKAPHSLHCYAYFSIYFVISFRKDIHSFGIGFPFDSLPWALEEADFFQIDSDVDVNSAVGLKQRFLSTQYFLYYLTQCSGETRCYFFESWLLVVFREWGLLISKYDLAFSYHSSGTVVFFSSDNPLQFETTWSNSNNLSGQCRII